MSSMVCQKPYWKKVCGVDNYKIQFKLKEMLYRCFRIALPKIRCQRDYWNRRGVSYMDEVFRFGHYDRELFFQNMLVDTLNTFPFDSFFEAGCGFGWNVRRVREEFPAASVYGLDFSLTQLVHNGRRYLKETPVPLVNGDNRFMPFKDKSIDVGFSLGVFMNIHPANIREALKEMCRVCRKRIIHLEWDASRAREPLRRKRVFKTNIISHDYRALYTSLGKEVLELKTYEDFADDFDAFASGVKSKDLRWEGYEGPDKYIFLVVAP